MGRFRRSLDPVRSAAIGHSLRGRGNLSRHLLRHRGQARSLDRRRVPARRRGSRVAFSRRYADDWRSRIRLFGPQSHHERIARRPFPGCRWQEGRDRDPPRRVRARGGPARLGLPRHVQPLAVRRLRTSEHRATLRGRRTARRWRTRLHLHRGRAAAHVRCGNRSARVLDLAVTVISSRERHDDPGRSARGAGEARPRATRIHRGPGERESKARGACGDFRSAAHRVDGSGGSGHARSRNTFAKYK